MAGVSLCLELYNYTTDILTTPTNILIGMGCKDKAGLFNCPRNMGKRAIWQVGYS